MSPSKRVVAGVGAVLVLVTSLVVAVPLFALAGGGTGATPPGLRVEGVPDRVMRAYLATEGWCPGLRWQLVAAIGAVESGHGTSGEAVTDPETGEVEPWIFGVPLDGSPGIARLPIGRWIGWWGLTGPWQQAVGPMQFLPGTFEAWAVDAEEDGVTNPHDIDDAAASAANYLCRGRDGSVTDERAALRRYNNSSTYVEAVLAIADDFEVVSTGPGPIVCPVAAPSTFTNTWLAPRSGGRKHRGVDMFAQAGAPVVAPASGNLELRSNRLGGLSFHLWGDDETYYYGAHLAGYGTVPGPVTAGTVVGYVGSTGNAAGGPPHLHFEIHPGRRPGDPPSPVDPTPAVEQGCRTV